jgi:hypothetical protein
MFFKGQASCEMVLDKRNIEPSPIETNHQIGLAEVFGSFAKGVGIVEKWAILSLVPDAEDTHSPFLPHTVPASATLVEALADF